MNLILNEAVEYYFCILKSNILNYVQNLFTLSNNPYIITETAKNVFMGFFDAIGNDDSKDIVIMIISIISIMVAGEKLSQILAELTQDAMQSNNGYLTVQEAGSIEQVRIVKQFTLRLSYLVILFKYKKI